MTIKNKIPNILSLARIFSVPILVLSAFNNREYIFIAIFIFALITDVLDGYLARKLNVSSEFGAKLDSWGDMAIYLSLPLCTYWLYPELVSGVYSYFLIVIFAYLLPILAGIIKFGKIPSYHTWSAKFTGVFMSISVLLIFTLKIVWLFKIAAVLQTFEAAESILITLKLNEPKSNVKSLLLL